jgi:hypothetical protein
MAGKNPGRLPYSRHYFRGKKRYTFLKQVTRAVPCTPGITDSLCAAGFPAAVFRFFFKKHSPLTQKKEK